MTSRKILKDPSFRILGYVDTDRQGRQTLKDEQFRILGYYEPRDDLTKDKNFRLVGRGNLLTTLL